MYKRHHDDLRMCAMKELSRQARQYGFEASYRRESSKSPHSKVPTDNTNFIGKLYVDRFGREREETYIKHDSEWELTFIDIWDPVDLKACVLNAKDKIILDQEPLDLETSGHELDIGVPGLMTYCIPRHSLCGGEDLGTKQIEGLICKGSRRNFPGYKECPSGVIECWYSETISYLVFAKSIFGNVESTFQLSNIRLIEPDKELFIIPAGYKRAPVTYTECHLGKNDDSPS